MKIDSPKSIPSRSKRPRSPAKAKPDKGRVRHILLIAEERGLLAGARTHVVRGRMPAELVAEAKRSTGITSDSKLLEAALANIVVQDDYGAWLIAHRGTISPELDLEF